MVSSLATGSNDPTDGLRAQLDILGGSLKLWALGDRTEPETRKAAETAVSTVGQVVADLDALRSALQSEISQAAADEIVDKANKLLRKLESQVDPPQQPTEDTDAALLDEFSDTETK